MRVLRAYCKGAWSVSICQRIPASMGLMNGSRMKLLGGCRLETSRAEHQRGQIQCRSHCHRSLQFVEAPTVSRAVRLRRCTTTRFPQGFNVSGPHICQPSPQRTPLLLQAGTSSKGKSLRTTCRSHLRFSSCSGGLRQKHRRDSIKGIERIRSGWVEYQSPRTSRINLGFDRGEAQAKLKDYRQYAS